MKYPRFDKFIVVVNGAVPLALLVSDAYWHQLGANPVSFAIQTTGMLTLVFLFLSLTVTPLRLATGWNYLSNFRRTLGLYAFFYGVIHLSTYFVFDRSLSIDGTIDDVIKRPFILIGMAGLLMMVPLAATSTNGMIKRLGAARWKRLHQLAYLAAIAGVVHYYLLVKADHRQPIAFAIVLAILFGYRIAASRVPVLRRTTRRPAAARPAPAA